MDIPASTMPPPKNVTFSFLPPKTPKQLVYYWTKVRLPLSCMLFLHCARELRPSSSISTELPIFWRGLSRS
jgi:hypothetical protein